MLHSSISTAVANNNASGAIDQHGFVTGAAGRSGGRRIRPVRARKELGWATVSGVDTALSRRTAWYARAFIVAPTVRWSCA